MHVSFLELLGLGFLVGSFGTLIGAGGGFILVPVLVILFPGMEPSLITSISLAVVFLNAASGSIAYARMKRIDYRSGIAFGLATLPGAVLGAWLTNYLPRHLFNIVLGATLILIALFIFIRPAQGHYSSKKPGHATTNRILTDAAGITYNYSFNLRTGITLSFFVGFVSSILGIGGGIIHVPALISFLNFPAHIATATSHFVLAIMALAGTIVHLIHGTLQKGITTAFYIGIGVIVGAQVGAIFSNRVKPKGIVQALAIALVIVGIRLFFE